MYTFRAFYESVDSDELVVKNIEVYDNVTDDIKTDKDAWVQAVAQAWEIVKRELSDTWILTGLEFIGC